MKKLFDSFYVKVLFLGLVFVLATGFYTYYDGGGSQHPVRFMTSSVPPGRSDVALTQLVPHNISTSFFHHEVHDGNAWVSSFILDMGLNETTSLVFEAPSASVNAHLTVEVAGTQQCEYYLLKNPDVAVADNALASVNLNCTTSTTALSTVSWVDGNIVGGDPWDCMVFGTGNRVGGSSNQREERVVAVGAKAAISILCKQNNTRVHGKLVWYEPDEEP